MIVRPFVLAAALVLVSSFASAQSLTDLAAATAKQRAAVTTPSVVYKGSGDVAVVAGSVASPVAASTSTPASGEGEAYWKGRMKAAVATRDNAQRQLSAALRQLETAQSFIGIAGSSVGLAAAVTDFNVAMAEVGRCRAAVQTETAAVQAIEEEARVAGALPGWLRW
jgi:hypothetical protein